MTSELHPMMTIVPDPAGRHGPLAVRSDRNPRALSRPRAQRSAWGDRDCPCEAEQGVAFR